MPPKKKVYRSIADSENLLQEFYENLEDDTLLDIYLLVKMMPRNMKPYLLIQILKKLLMLNRNMKLNLLIE